MTKIVAGYEITEKQENWLLERMAKFTKKSVSGVKIQTILEWIEYEAQREVNKTVILLTLGELIKSGKVINLPRFVAPHFDDEKKETAFYRVSFNHIV